MAELPAILYASHSTPFDPPARWAHGRAKMLLSRLIPEPHFQIVRPSLSAVTQTGEVHFQTVRSYQLLLRLEKRLFITCGVCMCEYVGGYLYYSLLFLELSFPLEPGFLYIE